MFKKRVYKTERKTHPPALLWVGSSLKTYKMNSEQRKKYDEQVALEYKSRKEKSLKEKEKARQTQQKKMLEPAIKKNIVIWIDKFNNGNVYEGSFGKEICFEIKRGLLSFSLKIVHPELKTPSKNNVSTELIKLQEIANKILWNNPKFLLKFKPVS